MQVLFGTFFKWRSTMRELEENKHVSNGDSTEDTKFANGLQTYMLSRDHHNLKSEFHIVNGKVTVDCIENQPAVEVALGVLVFLTVGDYLLSTNAH
ncbi:hypothetical protein RHSIM_RhsimUnG0171500 [Rhododendron simsii]|uniref:Uncharacterized protein n=1 Tax=Rhododendron simsii TaxID=118357 RepID=A0A834FWU0_RHOSS|nr:hypothetical protein RHSIM_RhsimUnG0171500 [Rhododendron simsii]